MANIFAPFGFRQYRSGGGGAPTYVQSVRKIAANNNVPIFLGDPVMPVVGPASGYITGGVAGATILAGIFAGCKYVSVSQKKTVWSDYWPGADAIGDVEAYVIDDPSAQFLVQTSGAALFNPAWTPSVQGALPIGQYAQFGIGTGNLLNGISGAFINAVGTTVTFPFIILDYPTFPPGANGTDPSTQFPNVVVGFNNEMFRTNGAGPLGIA